MSASDGLKGGDVAFLMSSHKQVEVDNASSQNPTSGWNQQVVWRGPKLVELAKWQNSIIKNWPEMSHDS